MTAAPELGPAAPTVDELVLPLLELARGLAWRSFKSAPYALDLDELTGVAREALCIAAARWGGYCAAHGYDPTRLDFFGAYATRRIKGAIIDKARAEDYVPRSRRAKITKIRDADPDESKTDEQVASATGLSVQEVLQARADAVSRPVLNDPQLWAAAHNQPVEPEDVESAAAVSLVLAAAVAAMRTLPPAVQVVLALHYYREEKLATVAERLGLTTEEVTQHHKAGVVAVYAALRRAVADG